MLEGKGKVIQCWKVKFVVYFSIVLATAEPTQLDII